MMRYILVSLIVLPLFFLACNEDILTSSGIVDELITEEEALSQNFDLPTPVYEMRIAIRDDVDVDIGVCSGIYYPSSDLIIIAKESLSPCGILRFWKHELGHRYGMAADHNNQDEFEPCIDPPDCDIIDFPEIFARE